MLIQVSCQVSPGFFGMAVDIDLVYFDRFQGFESFFQFLYLCFGFFQSGGMVT